MLKKLLSMCCIILCTIPVAYSKEQAQEKPPSSKNITQSKPKEMTAKQVNKTAVVDASKEQQVDQDKKNTEPKEKEEKIDMRPPYQTDAEVTGTYYLAKNHLIRDVYITTPINNKFYFKVFAAQMPVQGAMSVQYYNEIDGVAAFNKHGVGVFTSNTGNCDLLFFFKPPRLVIQQEKDCGMSPDFDIMAGGIYTQTENFNPITKKK